MKLHDITITVSVSNDAGSAIERFAIGSNETADALLDRVAEAVPSMLEQAARPIAQPKTCKRCGATGILHHDPDDPLNCVRVVCGKCQGLANRAILDRQHPAKERF